MRRLEGVSTEWRKDAAVFFVDTKSYTLDAVMGAAFVLVDRVWVRFEQSGAHLVRVDLGAKRTLTRKALEELGAVFCNELLAHTLRERSARRHGKVVENMLAKALFAPPVELAPPPVVTAAPAGDGAAPAPAAVEEPSLADLPGEDTDYLADPYGIAVPWEDKYGGPGKGRKKTQRR